MKKKLGFFNLVAGLAMASILSVANAAGGDNHAAVFLGQTKAAAGGSGYNTFALEYERRLPQMDRMFGIGVVAETIQSDPSATLVAAGVVVHPWKDLKVNIAAGQKMVSSGTVEGIKVESKSKSVLRVGAGYDFHYNNISYGPLVAFDSVGGSDYYVYGVGVGLGF
ncbi:MAG: hypothetical protein OEZ47_09830 [Gammaproteobacteria bacterium]|nr:hypothetical protein [Gammaproteobacteria bacterium]